MDKNSLYNLVNDRYGKIARESDVHTNPYAEKVAAAFGYSKEDTTSIPVGSNLGLGCGNPVAIASIKEGEKVLDLGSGAGFDAFLAAKKVGATGEVVGVDMNKDMLQKARKNAAELKYTNVAFHEGNITSIPQQNDKFDCIISNCVINLVPEPDKQLVFKEAFRVLKPGGRLAVSDILAKKDMPDSMKRSMALYVGCISNASLLEEYERYIQDAGFKECLIIDAKSDLNVYSGDANGATGCCANVDDAVSCCSGGNTSKCCTGEMNGSNDNTLPQSQPLQPADLDFNEWAGSFKIFALKPE